MKSGQNYIGGTWVDSTPESVELDVVRAVQAANKGQKQTISPRELRGYLWSLREKLSKEFEAIVEAEATESGRPVSFVRDVDLPRALGLLERFSTSREEESGRGTRREVPVGVIALVLSSERPLVSLIARLAPALAAGNSIVVKPSTSGEASVRLIAAMINKIDLPSGRFNFVSGGPAAGSALVRHPGVRGIDLQGRPEIARDVLIETADTSKKVRREVDSKNVAIVMRDADIKALAAPLARASLFGYQKILAQDEIIASLGEVLAEEFAKMRTGDPADESTDLAPQRNEREGAELRRWFKLALSEDGRPLTGIAFGGEGLMVKPMLISELTNCSELHQSYVRGPLITLNSFKYVTDAVKWANNSPFGLRASVWTKSLPWAHKLSGELNFGTILFNAFEPDPTSAPEYGLKVSGSGDSESFYSDVKRVYL